MTTLSGFVAIIRDSIVAETRDLGPDPIEVKDNVLQLVDQRPTLAEGERFTGPVYTIEPTQVLAVYGKEVDPQVAIDARASVFEADTERADLMSRLESATPAQIEAYVDSNITLVGTNITQLRNEVQTILRVVVKRIIKAMVQ